MRESQQQMAMLPLTRVSLKAQEMEVEELEQRVQQLATEKEPQLETEEQSQERTTDGSSEYYSFTCPEG